MDETQVKHFIMMERRKGTSMEELIFILHDNGVPVCGELIFSVCGESFYKI